MGAACGDPFYQNLVSESFGATNCYLQGSGTVVTLNAAICFGTLTASLKVIGSGVLDTGGSYFGILGAASAFVVDCTNLSGNAIWNSNGDQFAGGPIGPVPQFLFDCNGGVGRINLTGDLLQMQANTTSTNYGFYVPGSGLSIHVKNSTVSMAGSANLFLDIVAGSTYFDDGGHSYTLGGTASIVGAGSLVADGHSVKGICTGAMTASTTLGLYGTGPNATTTTCTSATIGTGLVVEGTRTLQLMACSVGGSATTTTTCTVVVNGSASAITCNITSGNTTCTDFIHTVALSDGALVSEEIIAGPATTPTGAQMIVVYN